MRQLFGDKTEEIINELNEVLGGGVFFEPS